jgi:hypothetical protein
MMRKMLRKYLSGWVLIGSVVIAAALCAALYGILWLLPAQAASANPTAVVMVIAAPSATPTQERVFITPTPTGEAAVSVGGIYVGAFVQISGTDGEGLRLRTGPGISNEPRFLGMDAELFEVHEGPKVADGYTWWYLVAPYDESRSGWAAADYLSIVPTEETDESVDS